jgi:hypothetical protein
MMLSVEHGGVTRITSGNRPQLTVIVIHSQHRQLVIDRADEFIVLDKFLYLAFFIVTAVHRETRLTDSPR